MLANLPANQQCVDFDGSGYLPSDLDGQTPPPAGSPNYILGASPTTFDQLDMYRFHVDWADPAQSDLAGPFPIPVAPFTDACATAGLRRGCIPQARTDQRLASLSGRVMYRLAYRNYGTHESLAANMSIAATDDPGWPDRATLVRDPLTRGELARRPPTGHLRPGCGVPVDGVHRDGSGSEHGAGVQQVECNSQSRPSSTPGGWPTDPLGTMRPERTVELPSVGSQTGRRKMQPSRWGDYTAMQVDPVDDCTFWYTNQYIPSDGVLQLADADRESSSSPVAWCRRRSPSHLQDPLPLTTGTVALSATASSGLPVSFTSLTTDVCTVSAATVTLIAGWDLHHLGEPGRRSRLMRRRLPWSSHSRSPRHQAQHPRRPHTHADPEAKTTLTVKAKPSSEETQCWTPDHGRQAGHQQRQEDPAGQVHGRRQEDQPGLRHPDHSKPEAGTGSTTVLEWS